MTIVGAGIAGAACAVALQSEGIDVRLIDRGRAPGGRMAAPSLHGRRVDIGASYFTVRDPGFDAVVQAWAASGQARPWTDTFAVLGPGQPAAVTTGPMRWSAPEGLRSLVRDLIGDIPLESGVELDHLPGGTVVLAMPDPQAARLVEIPQAVEYDPVISITCGFADRNWSFADAAFVHDHPEVEFIADDGARRGDGAAVLVVHTPAAFARGHLEDPPGAVAPVIAALRDLTGVAEPIWATAHRWTFAKPAGQHDRSFALLNGPDGSDVGLAGDQWCPEGHPRVEAAWRSGTDLGRAIAERRRLVGGLT